MMRFFIRLGVMSAALAVPLSSEAGIMTINPFVGTNSENFDNTGVDGATQVLDAFGGLATIRNLTSGERSRSSGRHRSMATWSFHGPTPGWSASSASPSGRLPSPSRTSADTSRITVDSTTPTSIFMRNPVH